MDYMALGSAVVVFWGVILGLVGVLMVARKQLVNEGDVTILINGDPEKAQKVPAGQTLLAALDGSAAEQHAADALEWLKDHGFLEQKMETWDATDLGRAASAAHLRPERVGTVVEDIKRARGGSSSLLIL